MAPTPMLTRSASGFIKCAVDLCACTANTISQNFAPACNVQQPETYFGSAGTVTRQERHFVAAEPLAQHCDSNQVELQDAGFQKLLQKDGAWEMVKVHDRSGSDANHFPHNAHGMQTLSLQGDGVSVRECGGGGGGGQLVRMLPS